MQICLDIQPAVAQSAGIGRYARHLVESLAEIMGDDSLSAFYFDFRRSAAALDHPRVTTRPFRLCPGAWVQAAWKMLDWPPANWFAGQADLYHFTNFVLPPLSRGKAVVTIHDMSFMRYPQFAEHKNLAYLTRKLPQTVERADAMLTISHFSADELIKFFPSAQGRTHAVPLGIDPSFAPAKPTAVKTMREHLGLERPYLLSVGTLEPRKNYDLLIDILERMDGFDGDVVIAGKPGWRCEPLLKRFHQSPAAERIRYVEYVPDGDLCALYTGAELYVTTSHYEGFGFPPLEAMACGTPVVSSRGGSLPEVLGDAALLVEGYDVEAWVAALTALLADTEGRSRLVQLGTARASRYTWARTARETLAVYKALAS